MSIRRWGMYLSAATSVAAASLVLPASVSAQTAQVLIPGEVQSLAQPGVPMKALPDGRVNTYGAGVDVAGVSFATAAGTGSEAVAAAPGSVLAVLHIVAQFDPMFSPWDDNTTADQAPFQAVVTAGSVSANLFPNGVPGNLDNYVVVDVPDSTQPVLTVSTGGVLPQSLNLSTGKRVGTAPQILYRDTNKPLVVVSPRATQGFTGTTDAGQRATGRFSITAAMLSYWQPFTTTFAPSPDQAYLVLFMGNDDLSVLGNTLFTHALPPADVVVSLPDGQTPQIHYGTNVDQISGLFGGFYWAQVPADIASAKVTVNLPAASPITANVGNQDGNQAVKVSFANPVSTEISFPAAWNPQNQAITIVPQPPGPARKNGSFPWIALLIPLLAIALAGALFFGRRRRAWMLPRELAWPPRALPPATTALLMRAPPLALPGGPSPTNDGEPPPGDAGAAPTPSLVIRLLGDVEIEGLRRTVRRSSVRRLLICLALSPERPLSTEELAMAISDHPDREPKVNSTQSYASILRGCLPPGLLPAADALDGYQLDATRIVVDWVVLHSVVNESPDSLGWAERARGALGLIRGKPLAGRSWEGIEPMLRIVNARVDQLARGLASQLIAAGDAAGAEWTVAQGLLVVPKSVGLWEDRLTAAAKGSGYGLERAWTDAQSELGPDAALLAGHYQRLRRSLGEQPAPTA